MKQKVFLVFFGVFLAFLLLETGLRVAGFLLSSNQLRNIFLKEENEDVFRIICIGESTTGLGGKNSYPSQLENILNQSGNGRRFLVFNLGQPAKNLAYIINRLPKWLEKFKPDLAITMLGINDEVYLDKIEPESHYIWETLKVYKLFRWIILSLNNRQPKTESVEDPLEHFHEEEVPYDLNKETLGWVEDNIKATRYMRDREYVRAEITLVILLRKMENKNTKLTTKLRPLIYIKFGEMNLRKNRYDKLGEIFKYFFETNASMLDVQAFLEKICNTPERARHTLPLLSDIKDVEPNNLYLYDLLSLCYEKIGEGNLSNEYSNKAREIRKRVINPDVQAKYLKIVNLLSAEKISLIAMQYPLRSIEPLIYMLKPAENFESIIFVGNEENFLKALQEEKYEEYFTDRSIGNSGHCTAKGNRLIAEGLAKEILSKF